MHPEFNFPHLAQRLFNVPLAIHPGKAEVIMASIAERLGISRINGIHVHAMSDFDDDFTEPKPNPRAGYDVANGIAIISIQGTLVQKLGTLRPYSGMTGYDGIRQNFLMALTDPAVKGIMLDIDSPGGECAGCFDLVDQIYAARGDKPIHAILGENAYSAAYALASAADRITVPRTGGVGSIGVVWMHVDWSKAISAAGINVTFLYYGDRKIDGHPEIPLSPEAKNRFQADINYMGELFIETVARNRKEGADNIRELQAASFTGNAGVTLRLADAVMPPDQAFRELVALIAEK